MLLWVAGPFGLEVAMIIALPVTMAKAIASSSAEEEMPL